MIRPGVLAAAGLAVAVISIAGTLSLDSDEASLLSSSQQAAADNGLAALPLDSDRIPTIDAVRIGAKGQVVITGRSTPGAVISVTDGEREWGGSMADGRGEWIFVPDGPLTLEPHTIRIEQVSAMGHGMATLYVGGRQDGWSGALAVAQLNDGSLHVLQTGGGAAKTAPPLLGWVEQTSDGRMAVGGVSLPGTMVEVHLDGKLMGRIQADPRGEWQMSARTPSPGTHRLRADGAKAGGDGDAFSEMPWDVVERPVLKVGALDIHPNGEGWVMNRPMGDGKSARLETVAP